MPIGSAIGMNISFSPAHAQTEVSYLRPRQGSQWRGLDSDVPAADLNPETPADVGTRSPGFWSEMKMEGHDNSMEIEPQIQTEKKGTQTSTASM